eukprot:365827-Chlamydomonas_euryale.AAC.2
MGCRDAAGALAALRVCMCAGDGVRTCPRQPAWRSTQPTYAAVAPPRRASGRPRWIVAFHRTRMVLLRRDGSAGDTECTAVWSSHAHHSSGRGPHISFCPASR